MLADKDIDKVVQRLTESGLPISDWFIAEIDYPRAASTQQLQNILSNYVDSEQIHELKRLSEATQAVINGSQPQDLIVVCGSFHTIGEALAALEKWEIKWKYDGFNVNLNSSVRADSIKNILYNQRAFTNKEAFYKVFYKVFYKKYFHKE